MLVALCYKCVKVGLISRELPETLPAVVLRIKDSHDHDARDTEAKQRAPLRWRALLAVVAIVALCATLGESYRAGCVPLSLPTSQSHLARLSVWRSGGTALRRYFSDSTWVYSCSFPSWECVC